jgi:NADPH:quinone reductase-like Zn-dependent oxidoreductase
MLEATFLAPLISIVGSRKMSVHMGKPFNKADVLFLTELLQAGSVTPVIDKRYPLGEVPEALRYQQEGRPRGKVVITV